MKKNAIDLFGPETEIVELEGAYEAFRKKYLLLYGVSIDEEELIATYAAELQGLYHEPAGCIVYYCFNDKECWLANGQEHVADAFRSVIGTETGRVAIFSDGDGCRVYVPEDLQMKFLDEQKSLKRISYDLFEYGRYCVSLERQSFSTGLDGLDCEDGIFAYLWEKNYYDIKYVVASGRYPDIVIDKIPTYIKPSIDTYRKLVRIAEQ